MITLRKANDSDIDWAFDIKSEAEYAYVERHFGWDEAFQRELHACEWSDNLPNIVEYAGERVGFYSIELDEGRHFLRRFFMAKASRNLGIGSIVIDRVLRAYQQANAPVWLAVFVGNPAKNLYLRHGFMVQHTTDQYEYLCWSPD